MKVGVHVSIAGSLELAFDRAVEKGCDTFQIFTRNPRGWKFKDLSDETIVRFVEKSKDTSSVSPVFDHMPYLPNLASPRDVVYVKSVSALADELGRCDQLGIPYLVTHLGSHLGKGRESGFKRIINGINLALKEAEDCGVMLLLENTAGTKNSMGSSFDDLRQILDNVFLQSRVGVCFDTSHAFAAGYDFRTPDAVDETLRDFDDLVGLDRLRLLHLNDSMGDLGSCVDRHEHIGLGFIGEEGFKAILRHKTLKGLPMILETPEDERRNDFGNLAKVRELAL